MKYETAGVINGLFVLIGVIACSALLRSCIVDTNAANVKAREACIASGRPTSDCRMMFGGAL